MLHLLLAPCLLAAAAQVQAAGPPAALHRLWALTTNDGQSGALVALDDRPPFAAAALAATDGGLRLRRFGRSLLALNTAASTVRLVPIGGGTPRDYALPAGSEPQDVLVLPASPLAIVTRRQDPMLLELDLVTGALAEGVDLSPVGGGREMLLGTMERDGTRLFVQVRVEPLPGDPTPPGGVLAVVDLAQHALVDVDPLAPGVQGIALQGAPPRGKMQILPGTRTLFVSTTDSLYDARGGIERVDLDLLASTGFALTEEAGGSDMGGFVMTAPDEGWYVFHTDFAPSTHLKHFTTAGGPDPGPEVVVFLGDTVDVLVHDPVRARVYLPSGFAWTGAGLYAVDTRTLQPLGAPLDAGLAPHDVVVWP